MEFSKQEHELAAGCKQNEMATAEARVDSWKAELRSDYQRAKTELPRIKKLCAEGLQFVGEANLMAGNLNLVSLQGDLGQLRSFCEVLPRQIEEAIQFHDDLQHHRIDTELEYTECLVITRRQLRSWDGASGHVNHVCGKIQTAIKAALASRPYAMPPTMIPAKVENPEKKTPVETDFDLDKV